MNEMFQKILPDNVIADIFKWLTTTRYESIGKTNQQSFSPTFKQLRNVVRFGSTCKRIRQLLCSEPPSFVWFDVWRLTNVGNVITESRKKEQIIKLLKHSPFLKLFGRISLHNQPLCVMLSLLKDMPNVREIHFSAFSISERGSSVFLKGMNHEEIITDPDLLSNQIASTLARCKELAKLRLEGYWERLWKIIDKNLTDTLEAIDIDLRFFIGCKKDSFPRILEMNLSNPMLEVVPEIANSCPSVEKLSMPFDENIKAIELIDECFHNLKSLEITAKKLLPDHLLSANWARKITKLVVANTSGNTDLALICKQIAHNCIHLKDLSLNALSGINGDCLRSLSKLQELESLSLWLNNAEQISIEESFEDFGNSSGNSLRHLSIFNSNVDLSLLFSTKRCKDLKYLSLIDCSLSNSAIEKLILNAKKLESVFVSSLHHSTTGVCCLSASIIASKCENLKYMKLVPCTKCEAILFENLGHSCSTSLISLKVNSMTLTDEILLSSLPSLSFGLRHLHLECKNITDSGLLQFARSCPNLRTLMINQMETDWIEEKLPEIEIRKWIHD